MLGLLLNCVMHNIILYHMVSRIKLSGRKLPTNKNKKVFQTKNDTNTVDDDGGKIGQ